MKVKICKKTQVPLGHFFQPPESKLRMIELIAHQHILIDMETIHFAIQLNRLNLNQYKTKKGFHSLDFGHFILQENKVLVHECNGNLIEQTNPNGHAQR